MQNTNINSLNLIFGEGSLYDTKPESCTTVREIHQNDLTLELLDPQFNDTCLNDRAICRDVKPLPVTVANGSLAWDPVLNMQ